MPAGVERKVLSVHVLVDVMSKDKLRKFSFGLDKTTQENDVEDWVIHFSLFERTTKGDIFGEPVLHVDVDVKARNFAKMDVTAAKGFNQIQTERTLVDVATVADRVNAGKAAGTALARSVERVIESREIA
jgi:hypothetical protein